MEGTKKSRVLRVRQCFSSRRKLTRAFACLGGAHAIHQMTLLQNFWQRQLQEIEHGDLDFKNFQLPLARIKKVMKTDEEVKVQARHYQRSMSLTRPQP